MAFIEIETKVAGVTFKNGDGLSRQEILEDILDELVHKGPFELIILRDKENPHDPNAIAVMDPKWRQIGFLNRRLAYELSPLMDKYADLLKMSCTACEVTGLEPDANYGLNITIRYLHPDS